MRFPTLTKFRLIRTAGILQRLFRFKSGFSIVPKKTFGRVALMLAIILIINQAVSYYWVSTYVIKPQIDQTMYLLASEVRMIEQQLSKNNSPETVFEIDSDLRDVGIRLVDAAVNEPAQLQSAQYYHSLTGALIGALNRKTEVRLEESDALYAWIRIPSTETLWLRVPLAELQEIYPPPQLIFVAAITFLSLAGGWWVAQSIIRPLKRLEFATREVGRGDRPGDLKVVGTREMRAVTKAFNQMARDVEQLEEDRTLLLAGISHDLRTPITRVRLACEFLPDSESEAREGIIRDTEDMDEIIDQFIGFVRDGRDESFKREDLNELAKAIATSYEGLDRDVRLELSELPKYTFKPLAMKRLVMNLVENAIRYGREPITISTNYDKENMYVRVLDQGDGIDEDKIEELFQPFKRGNSSRTGKGTGLGLAIVRRIAVLHEGDISLLNRPEGGVEARLLLPRNRTGNS